MSANKPTSTTAADLKRPPSALSCPRTLPLSGCLRAASSAGHHESTHLTAVSAAAPSSTSQKSLPPLPFVRPSQQQNTPFPWRPLSGSHASRSNPALNHIATIGTGATAYAYPWAESPLSELRPMDLSAAYGDIGPMTPTTTSGAANRWMMSGSSTAQKKSYPQPAVKSSRTEMYKVARPAPAPPLARSNSSYDSDMEIPPPPPPPTTRRKLFSPF